MGRESVFTALKPSEAVQNFSKENPNADWRDGLNFLIDRYPQMEGEHVLWLVEGGAAVHLHKSERKEPNDLDIVTRSQSMSKDFVNTLPFDVETVQMWLKLRGLNHTPEAEEFVMGSFSRVDYEGNELLIASPVWIAATKTVLKREQLQHRDKDDGDLKFLGVGMKAVKDFSDTLLSATYPI